MIGLRARRAACTLGAATLVGVSGCSDLDNDSPAAGRAVSATPSPSVWTEQRIEDGPTRFGAAFQGGQNRARYTSALSRTDQLLGRLEVVRVFNKGLPEPWPGRAAERDVVVSFKIDPALVLSGGVDDSMRTWFRTAPSHLDVFWVYFHEPENDVEDGDFSAADFRAAFAHLSALSREAFNPRLRATLVLMSYTLNPVSGRDWRDFYPGDDAVDVFAWDVYNRPTDSVPYTDPHVLLGGPRQVSESTGHPFAVAELGSVLADGDDGTGRAAWLREVGEYARKHRAEFVCYFDVDFARQGADYRLRDEPSISAWRSLSG